MVTLTNLSELQAYVNILEDYHEKKYSNYELLKKDLLIEFGIKVTIDSIRKLYEPTIEEDALDKQILYNNIMY